MPSSRPSGGYFHLRSVKHFPGPRLATVTAPRTRIPGQCRENTPSPPMTHFRTLPKGTRNTLQTRPIHTGPGIKGGSRPVSRVLSRTVIHLGHASPHASSDLPGGLAGHENAPLFGLAPGGVYPATGVATGAVRSYRTLSPLPVPHHPGVAGPSAVCSLWHFPSARAAQALPGTLPCGARTFLPPAAGAAGRRPSGRLPQRV